MSKKKVLAAACLIALATSAIAFSRPLQAAFRHIAQSDKQQTAVAAAGQQARRQQPTTTTTSPQTAGGQAAEARPPAAAAVPKPVIYSILFREMRSFQQQAHEMELQERDATALRKFHQNKFQLTDDQNAALARIASANERDVTRLDRKAREIIDAVRARHPNGRLAEGETLPPPPAELKALQAQRDAAMLQAREQLRAAFGAAKFAQFDETLQQEITRKLQPVRSTPRPVHLPAEVSPR